MDSSSFDEDLKTPADAWTEIKLPQAPDEPEVLLEDDGVHVSTTDTDSRQGHVETSASDMKGQGSGMTAASSRGSAYLAIKQRLRGTNKRRPLAAQQGGGAGGAAKKTSMIYGDDDIGGPQLNTDGGPRERLVAFVLSTRFEVTFAVLICMNTIFMALQVQYRGLDVGHTLNYFKLDKSAAEIWPGAQEVFTVFEWIFGVLFTGEIVLKILALRMEFCWDVWNWLDLVVVVAWIMDTAAQGVEMPLDPMLLRLLRLTKLLRMLRLIRTIQGFDSLYVMITAIKGSVYALTWSVLILFVVLMMIALLFSTLVESYITDSSHELKRRTVVYTYYGTFTRACLTLFELTLANWPTASRVLTENVSEFFAPVMLIFQATIGFSVVKVIMGVFLQVTFQVAANDDVIMMSQKERAIKMHTRKMSALFMAADEDGNGKLDEDEFQSIIDDPVVISWLSAMGFEAAYFNGRDVYKLLNRGEVGKALTAEEMIRGVSELKGPATSLNLAMMKRDNRATRDLINQVSDALQRVQRNLGIDDSTETTQTTPDEAAASEVSEPTPDDEVEEPRGRPKRASVSDLVFAKGAPVSAIDSDTFQGMNFFSRMQHRLFLLVTGFGFETFFSALIGINTLVMALQVQYRGIDSGHLLHKACSELAVNSSSLLLASNATGLDASTTTLWTCPFEYSRMTVSAAGAWPGAKEVFDVLEVFFGVIFTAEIILKLGGLGLRFVKDVWNLLDVLIVGFWYFEVMSVASLPLSPMILRLFRLVRLLRMARLVKFFEKFDALYLLMTSIKGSISALLWSSLLLIVVQMMLSLFMGTLLENYLRDDDSTGDKHKVYEYYGTFSRSMLTMFEITLGNWVPVTRLMMKNVTEVYVIFAVIHKFIVGFAFVMVITGVFVQETIKVAQTDNNIMLKQRQQATKLHVKKMSALFAVADTDGSGRLDKEEFMEVCADPQVKVWLSAMGLDVSNAEEVHDQICEQVGGDDLNAEELVAGVSRLKGNARNMDMANLKNENIELREMVESLQAKVSAITAQHKQGKI